MKKIVLALALAVVTPAVLVAQENGNAYNQNGNEVIAPSTPTQTSSVNYGLEGKALYHADLALARIRANRIAKEKEAQTQAPVQTQAPAQEPQATTLASNRVNIDDSYFHTGREGHMMALGHPKKGSNTPQNSPAPATKPEQAATPVTTQRTISTYNPYTGREGHMMAPGNAVRDAIQEQQRQAAPIPTYVRDADTVSNNHQVVLNSRSNERVVKNRNSSFRRNLRQVGYAVGQAIIAQAQYDK